MSLMAPERPPAYQPTPSEPPQPERRGPGLGRGVRRVLIGVVAVILVLTGLRLVLGDLLPAWLSWLNPFKTEQVDHSKVPVLTALRDLDEYRGASGSYQVVIDIERDTKFIPSWIKGERTIFLAQGSVDATIDLSGLGEDSVKIAPDGSVTITLPHAKLDKPKFDAEESDVIDQDRGAWDRFADFVGEDTNDVNGLYQKAVPKLRAAAQASGLVETAEENVTEMLQRLLGALGHDNVEVVFPEPRADKEV